jgi:hypothetical protein
MTYTKPQLKGFAAISAIQTSGVNAKTQSALEQGSTTKHTQPAYEADE